jgi:hypothetical protein
VSRNAANQTPLRKEGRANNFSVGTGLVLDVVGIVFVSWKAGITTHFAKRCSIGITGGRSIPGAAVSAVAVATVIRPHFYIDVIV